MWACAVRESLSFSYTLSIDEDEVSEENLD